MHKNDAARTKRRSGAVLAAVLLLGFASVGASAIALTLADRYRLGVERTITASARDSAAEDAMALALSWFTRELAAHDADQAKGLFQSQCLPVPDTTLAPLRQDLKGIEIDAAVWDQDYGSDFDASAKTLDLPRGRPSVVTAPTAEEGEETAYTALRFEVRTTATDRNPPRRAYTLRYGIIALYDESGRLRECVNVYVRKRRIAD